MSSEFLMYYSIIWKSDWREILLVTTMIPRKSKQMKSTRISNFTFLRALLMLATCIEEFFMNLILLSLLMGIITCFLEGPFIVIWIQGFILGVPLTMLLIWSIFFVLMEGNTSLILITSDMLVFCFKAWAYDFEGCLVLIASLLLLKYFEITLTSFWDLAGIDKGILSIFARIGLLISLLFLPVADRIFRVNLAVIFLLSKLDCLSA